MDFSISERQKHWRDRVVAFMDAHIYPAVGTYATQSNEGERWKVIPVLEELKKKARAEGLWNLFLPPSPHDESEYRGAGLTNLDYALCAEQMGRVSFASEAFNCSAPDTGNMEVLHRYGSPEQKAKWLRPLLAGEIRSAFLMTEPAVASSDATNIETSIVRDGDHYVINGRKWWSSGAMSPRCALLIVMGVTDPDAEPHRRQSMICVPAEAPGVTVQRSTGVFGYDDGPHGGHADIRYDNVRVPAANLVGAEGDGMAFAYEWFRFERLMVAARCLGAAGRLTEEMTAFAATRRAGGGVIADYGLVAGMLADSLTELFAARAMAYETARGIDRGIDTKVSHAQCSMAKLYCSEMAGRVADRAVQVFGGRGYMRENVAERFYRELRVERIWEGTSEIQRMIIARQMVKRTPATLA